MIQFFWFFLQGVVRMDIITASTHGTRHTAHGTIIAAKQFENVRLFYGRSVAVQRTGSTGSVVRVFSAVLRTACICVVNVEPLYGCTLILQNLQLIHQREPWEPCTSECGPQVASPCNPVAPSPATPAKMRPCAPLSAHCGRSCPHVEVH